MDGHETSADAALDELLTAVFGSAGPSRKSAAKSRERWGNAAETATTASNVAFVKLDFQAGRVSKITGTPGFDIIEASFTLERTGCLNLPVVTPIPFDRPAVQTETGFSPGTIAIQAQCKARQASTARTWVQGKRALATAVPGVYETQAPRETCGSEYEPFSGETVLLFHFSGSYQWTVTGNAVDGIWASGFGGA